MEKREKMEKESLLSEYVLELSKNFESERSELKQIMVLAYFLDSHSFFSRVRTEHGFHV